jgi:dimethylamine---corrinoid protein Co-methyltransferase
MDREFPTRMGDGSLAHVTRSGLQADIEEATALAARRAKVEPLQADELEYLLDIFASSARFTAVDIGDEVILSYDGTGTQQTERIDGLVVYEQFLGADSGELFHQDYCFNAANKVVAGEAQAMHDAQHRLTMPLHYGSQADLGRYSAPDGPVPNWSELLPQGRIEEARTAQDEAAGMAAADMRHVADVLWEAGADGIDFDTSGAAGDAEFAAVLGVVRQLRATYPHMSIEVGMASEFVLGMHGRVEFDGTRLAGLWPHDQVRVVQRAGATIFGPCVNVNTTKTVAWNVARAVTILKPCVAASEIPVHVNAGMGVGGVPMATVPPIDAVSRVSKALVELLHVDGL